MHVHKKIGGLLFLAGAQFAILLIVAETQYHGYDVGTNYISDLGLWDKGSAIIFNPSVFMFGLLGLMAAILMYREYKFRLECLFLALSGIGAMGVGIFNETHVLEHYTSAMLAFLFGALTAIIFFRRLKAPLAYMALFLGIASLVALVLMGSGNYLGLRVGGMERMILCPELVFIIGLGGYMSALEEPLLVAK